MIVCPWPPEIEPPPAVERHEEKVFTVPLTKLLEQATTLRLHDSFYQLRRSFARIGVSVLCARGDDPVPLIVDRLDRLRTARFRRGR